MTPQAFAPLPLGCREVANQVSEEAVRAAVGEVDELESLDAGRQSLADRLREHSPGVWL
jgi:hypothetical protein